MTLDNILNISPNEIWTVKNSQIVCSPKKKGRLNNLLQFNKVLKVAQKELFHHSPQDVTKAYQKLSLRYQHLNDAISKQNLITRFFLKIVLMVYRLDENIKALSQLQGIIKQTSPVPSLHDSSPILPSIPPTNGTFAIEGNACFVSSALHILNVMVEVLPKTAAELTQFEAEKDRSFQRRKEIVEEVLEVLRQSREGISLNKERMDRLRTNLYNYQNGFITKKGNGGDATALTNNFLTLFQFQFERFQPNRQDRSKDVCIPTNRITSTDILNNKGFQYKYKLKEKDGKLPLFLPCVIPSPSASIPDMNTVAFFDSKGEKVDYDLVACIIGYEGHAFPLVKKSSQWIRYEDEALVCPNELAFGFMKERAEYMIFKRRD